MIKLHNPTSLLIRVNDMGTTILYCIDEVIYNFLKILKTGTFLLISSVVDPNTLNSDPDPGF